jgi:hypothetical protein
MALRILASVVMLPLVLFLGSCSKDSTSSTAVTSLSALPAATGPVSGSAILKEMKNRDIKLFSAATGLTFAQFDGVTWSGATKSRPFCESGRIVREAYLQAANPDKILCYIGAMKDAGAFSADVDDGNYKYYSVSGSEDRALTGRPGGSLNIKFKVVKSGSAITRFEMFMCQGSTQDGYVSEDISNPAASTVLTKFISSGSNEGTAYAYATQTDVAGAINSSGAWTSKVITMKNTNSFGSGGASGSYRQKATITQYSSRVDLDAFMAGTFGSDEFNNRLYAVIQILNPSQISTFAMGDGSAKYILSHTHGTTQTFNNTASWLGDTYAPLTPASSGEQYATANAATPRAVEAVSVTFTADETWDCNPPSGTSFTSAVAEGGSAGLTAALAACDTKYGSERGGYVQCWEASGE